MAKRRKWRNTPNQLLHPWQQGGGGGVPNQLLHPWQLGGSNGGGGGTAAPAPGPAAPVMAPAQQGAFDLMLATLQQYGLGSLAGTLQALILDGVTDAASLTLALQDTDAWKQRFAGNEALRAAGLPLLSVAEYLSVERSYSQVLKNFGLPSGFYDEPSDFAGWIGQSVSAAELQERAQMWSDMALRDDPAVRAQLKSMGLTEGDILAYMMDPTRALPLIQRQYQKTLIGAAARRGGIVSDNTYLDHLVDIGITEQQAIQGYGFISENLGAMQNLGDIYNEGYTLNEFETEVFEQDGAAARKRKRLASRERANFAGDSGITTGSMTGSTAGSY